jgi:uncharacterized membrane protein
LRPSFSAADRKFVKKIADAQRIWHIIKEFIRSEDRRMRIVLFVPPLIQLITYGYAVASTSASARPSSTRTAP